MYFTFRATDEDENSKINPWVERYVQKRRYLHYLEVTPIWNPKGDLISTVVLVINMYVSLYGHQEFFAGLFRFF